MFSLQTVISDSGSFMSDTLKHAADTLMEAIPPADGVITEMQRLGGSVAEVVQNTSPYDFGWGDLAWWNFGIGLAALIAGTLAAIFGFLGFRYQKRAAISLEGREGKAFQIELLIRMIYSNISSLIAFHSSLSKGKKPVPHNKIDSLKVPQDIVDPAVFANDSEVYGKTVLIRRDIGKYNHDLDSYASYYKTDPEKETVYMGILLTHMIGLLDTLGYTMATIDMKSIKSQIESDFKHEIWAGFKKEIKEHKYFWYALSDYLDKRFSKKGFYIKRKYYCPYIAKAVACEHFKTLQGINQDMVNDLIARKDELPDVIHSEVKRYGWDAIVVIKNTVFEIEQEQVEEYRKVLQELELSNQFPHLSLRSWHSGISLVDFLDSALRLEVSLKQVDERYLQ